MPTKAELYAQMADKVATQLTGSWQEWAEFLTTASRLYKYPFRELSGKVITGNIIDALQHGLHRIQMALLQLPQPGSAEREI